MTHNFMSVIAYTFCGKCGKTISLDYYPRNKTIAEELEILEEEHQLHLCTVCAQTFATCSAKKILFGDCVGNDNVIECDQFEAGVR